MSESQLLSTCYVYDDRSVRHYFEDGFVIPKIFVTGDDRQMAAASTELDYCLVEDARIALHALMAAAANAHTIGTIEQIWVDPKGMPINDLSWDEAREQADIDPSVRAGIATRAIHLPTDKQLEMFTSFSFDENGEGAVERRWRKYLNPSCGLPATAAAIQVLSADHIDLDRIVRFAMKNGYVVYEGAV